MTMATTTITPTPHFSDSQPSRPAFGGPYTNDDWYVKRKFFNRKLRRKIGEYGSSNRRDPLPHPLGQ